jgi:hypothetical protein
MAPDQSDYCNGDVARICLAALDSMVLVASRRFFARFGASPPHLHGRALAVAVSATSLASDLADSLRRRGHAG